MYGCMSCLIAIVIIPCKLFAVASKPGGSKEKEVSAKSRVTLLTGTTSGTSYVFQKFCFNATL